MYAPGLGKNGGLAREIFITQLCFTSGFVYCPRGNNIIYAFAFALPIPIPALNDANKLRFVALAVLSDVLQSAIFHVYYLGRGFCLGLSFESS